MIHLLPAITPRDLILSLSKEEAAFVGTPMLRRAQHDGLGNVT